MISYFGLNKNIRIRKGLLRRKQKQNKKKRSPLGLDWTASELAFAVVLMCCCCWITFLSLLLLLVDLNDLLSIPSYILLG